MEKFKWCLLFACRIRHMEAVHMRKENQIYVVDEKRAFVKFNMLRETKKSTISWFNQGNRSAQETAPPIKFMIMKTSSTCVEHLQK